MLTDEGIAEVAIGTNHVRAQIGDIRFTSKLIDGRFPEYSRVIPAAPASAIRADRDVLRQALQRTAILSNEKYRGIRVTVKKNMSHRSGAQSGARRSRGRDRSRLRRQRSGSGLQRELSAGCPRRHRWAGSRAGSDRQQQQLPDSVAREYQRALCRDADEAISRGLEPTASNGFPLLAVGGISSRPTFHADQRTQCFRQDQSARGHLRSGPRPLVSHAAAGASHSAWRPSGSWFSAKLIPQPGGCPWALKDRETGSARRSTAISPPPWPNWPCSCRCRSSILKSIISSRKAPAAVAGSWIGVCSTWSNPSWVTGSDISRC